MIASVRQPSAACLATAMRDPLALSCTRSSPASNQLGLRPAAARPPVRLPKLPSATFMGCRAAKLRSTIESHSNSAGITNMLARRTLALWSATRCG